MALKIADRILALGIALALVFAALCALQRLGGRLHALENLERLTLDLRFRLRGPEAPGDAVAIVAIDDAAIARYPLLSERRDPFAALLRAIGAAGAAVIGVDAILVDREQILDEALSAEVEAHVAAHPGSSAPADRLLARVAEALGGDRHLAAAIAEVGGVVLGLSLGGRGEAVSDDPELAKGRYGQSIVGPTPPLSVPRGLVSLPIFNAAAAGLGMITFTEDQDQTIRELHFARRFGDGIYAPMAATLLAARDRVPRSGLVYLGGESKVRIGAREVELGPGDRMILNFRGPAATFPTYSAADVLDGEVGDALAGKIVLVGITYLGYDRARTPLGPQFPAVELHATAIDNILAGDPIRRVSPFTDVAVCALLGLLATLLFARRLDAAPAIRFGGLGLLVGGQVLASHVLFARYNLWLGAVWPLLAVALIGGLGIAAAYAGEARQRRWLRRSFSHYLGGETLDQLLADPGALALGGARRRLSVLFSDIRDFTTISESLSPEELVDLLNLFLTPMSRAVLSRGGYLDKYIGDAVMAVFGAPVPHADHGGRALATAIAMQRALDELGPELARRGLRLEIGVGVNAGEMVVGNMGSVDRFDYTVVGDAVNLASRLEGLTKIYGVRCLVGEGARALAPEEFAFREVDRVRVKGKAEPVAIFELLGGPEGELAAYADLPAFEAALAAYRRGDLALAREGFVAFAGRNPGDRVSALYLERLAELGDQAPAGWDGVTTFRTK
ncbi:MAG: adenylate/guanylate cyclase domain-containing protein [Myxococcales bacterium]|nr:adenylate/guanylate cyclase domain-containing protein [Myxococcales bacterium]